MSNEAATPPGLELRTKLERASSGELRGIAAGSKDPAAAEIARAILAERKAADHPPRSKAKPTYSERIEQKGAAFQTGFMLGAALAVLGYVVSLSYAYMTMGGFGLVASVLIAVVTTALLATAVGPLISGFVVAAMSDGRLSWVTAAVGPFVGAAAWALVGLVLAETLGAVFKLFAPKGS